MASVEIQGKRVYFRIPQKSKDDEMPIWQKFLKIQKVTTLLIDLTL